MNFTTNILKMSIVSETNYRYAFSDEQEVREDANNRIEYELEIPTIDFQVVVDLFVALKNEKIESVHYYCSKVIPFDTEAPASVWNHFETIEKNTLRNRSIGVYEKPMYIFYVKELASFLILSVRNFNSHVETKLNEVFNAII